MPAPSHEMKQTLFRKKHMHYNEETQMVKKNEEHGAVTYILSVGSMDI